MIDKFQVHLNYISNTFFWQKTSFSLSPWQFQIYVFSSLQALLSFFQTLLYGKTFECTKLSGFSNKQNHLKNKEKPLLSHLSIKHTSYTFLAPYRHFFHFFKHFYMAKLLNVQLSVFSNKQNHLKNKEKPLLSLHSLQHLSHFLHFR